MTNNPEPNPIRDLFGLIQQILLDFRNLIRQHQWFNLSLYLSVVLFLLFAPDKGFFYSYVANFITDTSQYTAIFGIIFFLVFAIGIFLEVIQLISRSENWIKLLLRVFLIGLILFTVNRLLLSPLGYIPDGIHETYSYGKESLFQKNSPETKIAKQNEDVLKKIRKPLKIAVTVPISLPNGSFSSNEFLRGVNIAQNKWNQENKNLQVIIGIADDGYQYDENNSNRLEIEKIIDSAISIAEELIKEQDILAVIQSTSSDATQATASTYKKGKLVAISASSTAKREKNGSCDSSENEKVDSICLNEYIFRTAIDDEKASDLLVKAIIKKNNLSDGKKIGIIVIAYDSNSVYSNSFKSAFKEKYEAQIENNSILIDDECDFAKYQYKGKNCLDFAQKNNADAILLVPGDFITIDKKVESIITGNFQSKDKHLFLLGSDTMYKQSFVVKNGNKRKDTEGMLIPLVWHRSVLNECSTEQFDSELECKAAEIFLDQKESQRNKPLAINWRTATAYESTKAILEGLKIAKEKSKYCGGLLNFGNLHDCMRQKLKDVLISKEFDDSNVTGAKDNTSISFEEDGERFFSDNLGVVVEAKNKNFQRFEIEDEYSY
jgi:ABC-type branched-subunit amino acid transport system substrate-binding protein